MTDAKSPHLLSEREGHVLTLTLNRPAQRNALSPELVCRLSDAWKAAEHDPDVRVIVLAASGPAFSAGADLRLLIPLLAGDRLPQDQWDDRVLNDPDMAAQAFMRRPICSKPVIAAVNGIATGGGLELVLATTLRVAAATAKFGLSEVQRGLIPGGGGVARLPRQIFPVLAMELLLTGDFIGAGRAAAIGLVNYVVPGDQLTSAVTRLAERIASNGPLAIRLIIEAVSKAEGRSLAEAFDIEARSFDRAVESEDGREGAVAFLEKRAPRFIGR